MSSLHGCKSLIRNTHGLQEIILGKSCNTTIQILRQFIFVLNIDQNKMSCDLEGFLISGFQFQKSFNGYYVRDNSFIFNDRNVY